MLCLRCCDDLRIMFSKNVFCGATRPLRPPGIFQKFQSTEVVAPLNPTVTMASSQTQNLFTLLPHAITFCGKCDFARNTNPRELFCISSRFTRYSKNCQCSFTICDSSTTEEEETLISHMHTSPSFLARPWKVAATQAWHTRYILPGFFSRRTTILCAM